MKITLTPGAIWRLGDLLTEPAKREDRVKRKIHITIVTSGENHCSNDCPGMSNNAKCCNFFGQELVWDLDRTLHGNFRVRSCTKAELWKKDSEEASEILRETGPIETKLRSIVIVPGWIEHDSVSDNSNGIWACLLDAADNLGVRDEWLQTSKVDVDVFSEAIEAAEALNL